MALYRDLDGDDSCFLSELDKELSDDVPRSRDPEYVPDESGQILGNILGHPAPNPCTIHEALQVTAYAADANNADLKGITIHTLVEQFYSAQYLCIGISVRLA
jgi:hypothetical protein